MAWILATLIVLYCTAVLARSDGAASFPSKGADLFVKDGGPGYRVAVFIQERDCTSNLAFLQLLARPEFSKVFSVVVYDVGGPRSEDQLAVRLRSQGLPFPSRSAPRGSVTQLRRMGYHTTPVLVLLSPENRVRMAFAAPRTRDEMWTLASALHLLTGVPKPAPGTQ